MAFMEKYGENRSLGITIRVIAALSILDAVVLYLPGTSSQFYMILIIGIFIFGIMLVSMGSSLAKQAGENQYALGLAGRAKVFGWLMITSLAWGGPVFFSIIQARHSVG